MLKVDPRFGSNSEFKELISKAMYFFIGGTKKGVDLSTSAPHHTPDFYVDDSALATGVRSMTSLALDYIFKN